MSTKFTGDIISSSRSFRSFMARESMMPRTVSQLPNTRTFARPTSLPVSPSSSAISEGRMQASVSSAVNHWPAVRYCSSGVTAVSWGESPRAARAFAERPASVLTFMKHFWPNCRAMYQFRGARVPAPSNSLLMCSYAGSSIGFHTRSRMSIPSYSGLLLRGTWWKRRYVFTEVNDRTVKVRSTSVVHVRNVLTLRLFMLDMPIAKAVADALMRPTSAWCTPVASIFIFLACSWNLDITMERTMADSVRMMKARRMTSGVREIRNAGWTDLMMA